MQKTPVILDTDIGSDIDDTWALCMLLNSPELELRLVTTADGNTPLRAALAAKYLHAAGRSDIPVGVGVKTREETFAQAGWIDGYTLEDYPGTVHADGVGALIECVLNAETPVTILSIGPMTNIAAALEREPRIAQKARLVGMQGSVYKGYENSDAPMREYNVFMDVDACAKAFAADWEVTITPLDTCGTIVLRGEKFQKLLECTKPATVALLEGYRRWSEAIDNPDLRTKYPHESTTLFDTVAVYLACQEDLVEIEEVGLRVDAEGFTRIDPAAKRIRCAVRWKDFDAYTAFLLQRLL